MIISHNDESEQKTWRTETTPASKSRKLKNMKKMLRTNNIRIISIKATMDSNSTLELYQISGKS